MMNRNTKQIGSFLLFCLLITSLACNRVLYAPSDLLVGRLGTKGAHQIGGQLQAVGEGRGAGIQGVVALTDHIAVKAQANGYWGKGEYTDYSTSGTFRYNIRGRGVGAEASAGWHSAVHEHVHVAVFAGGGVQKSNYQFNSFDAFLNYGRVFVQPECVFTTKYADVGLGLRGSYVRFYKGAYNAGMPREFTSEFSFIRLNPNWQLPEAQLMLGGQLGRLYLRNHFTVLLAAPEQPVFSRLQFGTSVVYGFGGTSK